MTSGIHAVVFDALPAAPHRQPLTDVANALVERGYRGLGRTPWRSHLTARLLTPTLPLARTSRADAAVVPMMWCTPFRVVPYHLRYRIVPLVFDAWPNDFKAWEQFLATLRPPGVLFTSRDVADWFEERGFETGWVPEAAHGTRYVPGKGLVERPTQLLELGRTTEWIHRQVAHVAADVGVVHRFPTGPGQFVFPSDGLVQGLAASAIVVAYPKSVTHPTTARGIETVTQRYFEAMASRTLMVGHAPQELVDLLGFNPVVEARVDELGAALADVLRGGLARWQPHVDHVRDAFLDRGTWQARAREVERHVNGFLG